jgi:condensin complex subunit 3
MPTRPTTSEDIREGVIGIFHQAQTNVASHKKNVVQLLKLQGQAAQRVAVTTNGSSLTGEKEFNTIFQDIIYKILPLKRGITVGDRIVKFVGAFVRHLMEKRRFPYNLPMHR